MKFSIMSEGNPKKQRKRYSSKYVLFVVVSIALIWVMPLMRTLVNSFRYNKAGLGLGQYKRILLETPIYLNMYWNSIIITTAVVAGSVVISCLGAYGFTMLRFKGKELVFFLYILVMLLPLQVTLMPNYLVARVLRIEESYLAIILPAIFNPFGVFLLRQQMKLVPWECVEAAQIDGADKFQVFVHIFLPMVRSGIMALVMLLIIEYWNLIDQVIVFIREPQRYPVSVFLYQIISNMDEVSYAASTFYLIPIIALLSYGHEYLKEGIGLMGLREH